eukprot:406166-Pyramimonas_sp.AAC.1
MPRLRGGPQGGEGGRREGKGGKRRRMGRREGRLGTTADSGAASVGRRARRRCAVGGAEGVG